MHISDILAEHRTAFLAVTEEVHALARSNRELLARGYQAAKQMLDALGETRADVYTPAGVTASHRTTRLLDEAL